MRIQKQDQRNGADDGDARPNAERLADELKKLSEAVLWKNHSATYELKDAVKLIAAELSRTADTLRKAAPALEALRDEAAVQAHLALLGAKDRLTLLDDLNRADGLTIIVVTHDPNVAGHANRQIVMSDGSSREVSSGPRLVGR